MSGNELHWASIAQLSRLLERGDTSSEEITRCLLERIGQHDSRVHAFIHLAEDALEQARQADKRRSDGRSRGRLDGIPVGVKDNYLTQNMPTTAGTRARGIEFAREDAECTARLRAAGCVLLGKTRTHEFAWGTTTPPVCNPWALERVPGGSSGGTGAAVAAGFIPAGLGSDTGGSIRIPASFCGVVGLKPTFGRVSRAGIVPHSWSLDHPGPLTRTVEDAALLLGALAGYDPRDPGSRNVPVPDFTAGLDAGVRGLRVVVIDNHFMDRNTPAVQRAVEAQLESLAAEGAQITHRRMPMLAYGLGAIYAIELASSGAYHDHWLAKGTVAEYEPDVRLLVEMGRLVSAVDMLKAEQVRSVLMEEFRQLFEQADVVVTPTEPITAWQRDTPRVVIGDREESALGAAWRLTYPFNLTGLPAISVPCGHDANDLPIGLQIVARPDDEASVLRCAAAVERMQGPARHPTLD